jgi:DNA-binding NarL/FixJ family response regulator
MADLWSVNLKVLLLDSDYYALQAINSYLAWDRRTRVTFMAEDDATIWSYLENISEAEMPDVVVMDADHAGGAEGLTRLIQRLRKRMPDVMIICLAQFLDASLVQAAIEGDAKGYFMKHEVRLQIAWAIVYALKYPLVVTPVVARQAAYVFAQLGVEPRILPDKREYPELTDRIRQAIELCVIEGMPAHLAADEMGISLHTIRGYVKEGYRILESHDETDYLVDMTPQERAFMRFTALDLDDDDIFFNE